MISTTYTPQSQPHAELTPKPTERLPILSRHWPEFPKRAHRPALRLVSDRSSPSPDDVVDFERLAWVAHVEAFAAHDKHQSVATKRCFDAAFNTWQRVFLLDDHGRVQL